MAEKSKYFVTTPIYYVTSGPHIGSLYSTLIADVAARYHALLGKNVSF
jgi:methionyl-tRNA synthetase